MSLQDSNSHISGFFLSAAAISGFVSVALGAFAAHGLESMVSAARLETFHTGVEYQFYHSLALLLVAILSGKQQSTKALLISGYAFLFGIIVFSGSLYLLVLLDIPVLGAITPVGGTAFLLGWLCLAVYGLRYRA